MDVKEKVTNGFVEGLLTEVFNGLVHSGATTSPFPMHTLLLDICMCAWTTLQNYQQYRNRELWRCDADMCEITTDYAASPSPPSTTKSGISLNAGGSCVAGTGTMVSFLIPVIPEESKATTTSDVTTHSHHHMGRFIYGCDFNGVESVPSRQKVARATTTVSTSNNIGRRLLKYALMTMLVNVVSHDLLPIVLHLAEGVVQQAVDSLTVEVN